MIFAAHALPLPGRISADLCVVGSGPGGLTAATVAAEAGLKVVVLEAGELVTPARSSQREEEMLPRLMWDAGARTTTDRRTRVLQGHGVGGSSLHNLNLCKRIPTMIRERWALERLTPEVWDGLYEEVEALLDVKTIPEQERNRINLLLKAGAETLGWRGGPLQHNRTGCIGSGWCALGCAYDAKNNALKVFAPRFVKAGGQLLTCCQAVRVRHEGGRVRGIEAVAVDPTTREVLGEVEVRAERVCLSASATGTAALLLRSSVPDPSERTGRGLHLHPGLVAIGDFPEPVRAWEGVPQSWECTEWLDFSGHDRRSWLLPAFAHPASAASMVGGHGAAHREWMTRYAHLAGFSTMLHDESAGAVAPRGDLGLTVDYAPSERDRSELLHGLRRAVELLFAAGATRVLVPSRPFRVLGPGDAVGDPEARALADGRLELTAVHPMSTVPMGDDPGRAPVDSAGKHHHLEGLWVADGSLFPESIGVPPQLSIYAMGLHVGRNVINALR